MDWQDEKALMEREMKKMMRKVSKAHSAARAAHDLKIAAETRAHDMKVEYKSMKNNLARCELDARRYQWMRLMGLRFMGVAAWLFNREADHRVDEAIAVEGRGPSQTEREVMRRRPTTAPPAAG